jgi:hypothetical protein
MTIETMAKFGAAPQLTLAERQKIMDVLGVRKVALRNLAKKIREGMNQEMEEVSDEG